MSWLQRFVERIVAFALQLAQALIVGIVTAPFRALKRSAEPPTEPEQEEPEEGEE